MYDDCPADMDPDVATLLETGYPAMLEDLPHLADSRQNEDSHRPMDESSSLIILNLMHLIL